MSKINKVKMNGKEYYRKQVPIGRNENGQIKYKSVYGLTQREVNEKEQEVYKKINQGFDMISKVPTFSSQAFKYIENYCVNMSEHTKQSYSILVSKYIAPDIDENATEEQKSIGIGHIAMDKLEDKHLINILKYMESNGLSHRYMLRLKQLCVKIVETYGVKRDYLRHNPFTDVPVPTTPKNKRTNITELQRKAIIKALTFDNSQIIRQETKNINGEITSIDIPMNKIYLKIQPIGHRMNIPSVIMLMCGLRRGEMLALKWKDINLKDSIIVVNKSIEFINNWKPEIKEPKTESGKRVVPIPNYLHSILSSEMEKHNSEEYIAHGNSEDSDAYNPMTESAFKRAWESYLHYLNLIMGGKEKSKFENTEIIVIDPFTPHQLRHTYASDINAFGLNDLMRTSFMGHSDIEITNEVYTHETELLIKNSNPIINKGMDEIYKQYDF